MRFVLSFLLGCALLWLMAFGLFLVQMRAPDDAPRASVDALVVLTGSSGRVERGFELLAQGNAPLLYISGAGAKVTVADMLNQHASPALREEILAKGYEVILDHAASTTQTNATESAVFIRTRHYQTIRLITGHYHMPRSLVEFRAVLPDVTILTEPVLSDQFEQSVWWQNPSTRRVVLQEFHKYLAAQLRVMVR